MKRWTIVILCLLAVFAIGAATSAVVSHFALSTPRVPWRTMETITGVQATLPVTARDYSTVQALTDANTVKYTLWDDVSGMELRFQTTADADATVVEIWVAAWDYMQGGTEDSYALGAILTLTGGTQTGPNSNVFVDTIVQTADTGIISGAWVSDSAANRMAIWRCDMRGWKEVVIIATTLQGSSELYADVRWY